MPKVKLDRTGVRGGSWQVLELYDYYVITQRVFEKDIDNNLITIERVTMQAITIKTLFKIIFNRFKLKIFKPKQNAKESKISEHQGESNQ